MTKTYNKMKRLPRIMNVTRKPTKCPVCGEMIWAVLLSGASYPKYGVEYCLQSQVESGECPLFFFPETKKSRIKLRFLL
jgi:hypothetical protein